MDTNRADREGGAPAERRGGASTVRRLPQRPVDVRVVVMIEWSLYGGMSS